MKSSVHIVISGMVQGVGFRYFVQHHARQLGLTGWVRNLPNGRVEIMAEGNRDFVESFIVYVQRGPHSAVVSNAEVMWKEPGGQFESFDITY
jgi:acylphosphatase